MTQRSLLPLLILNLLLPGCQHTASADHSLRTAARAGNLQAIQQAIEQGETVNPPPGLNQTPLGHLLHQYKRSNTTQQLEIEQAATYLLDMGADPNALHHGFTPLQIAAGQGSIALISLLIERGGDPSLETSAGLAPIWQAVFDNDFRVAYELLRSGANPNALNESGQTPLEYLRAQGHTKTRIMLYLRRFGGH